MWNEIWVLGHKFSVSASPWFPRYHGLGGHLVSVNIPYCLTCDWQDCDVKNDQHKENQTYQTWPISGGYNSKKIIYFYFYIGLGGEVAFVIRFQKRNFTSNELKSQYDVVVENALFACSTTKEYEVSPRWHLIITEDSSTQLLKDGNARKKTPLFF